MKPKPVTSTTPMTEEVPAEDRPDVWALWPDEFMCPCEEVEQHMRAPLARGDDYQLVEVLSYWYDGEPERWRLYGPQETNPTSPDA